MSPILPRGWAPYKGIRIMPLPWLPDGAILASDLVLWDVASQRPWAALQDTSYVHSVAFSLDGTILASSGDNIVVLWDVAKQRRLAILEGHAQRVNSVAFSPDGAILASGSDDRTVVLWDTASRRQLVTLEGHADSVHSVAFSPDGTMLASGSSDHTVVLWDVVRRGRQASKDIVQAVAFSPRYHARIWGRG